MSDKELADKVVALGVECGDARLFMNGQILYHEFLTDWRVAGALMEKTANAAIYHDGLYVCMVTIPGTNRTSEIVNKSLPRAIIEACVEALEQSDG